MNISSIGARLSSSPQGFASKNSPFPGKYEAADASTPPQQSLSLEQFSSTIEQEFIAGSAIDPVLFAASVRVVPDVI